MLQKLCDWGCDDSDIKILPTTTKLYFYIPTIKVFDFILPKNLIEFQCDGFWNYINTFNSILPSKLEILNLSNSEITIFSHKLPHSLKSLTLTKNKLIVLKIKVPNSLTYLNIRDNSIKKLKLNRTPKKIYYDIIKNRKTFNKRSFY